MAASGERNWDVLAYADRFSTGYWTQRSPLRDAGTPFLYESYARRFDSIIGGRNVEVTNKLTIKRRPGHSVYNSQLFPSIQRFYPFRQFSTNSETITVIADSPSAVWDATGPSTKTLIFAKSLGSTQSYFLGVGNVLYFGNGVDEEKYYLNSGVPTTQIWGVSIGGFAGSTTNIAGSGANSGVGGTAWTNPNNVTSLVAFATVTLVTGAFGANSQGLNCLAFGFGVTPAQAIVGIEVTCEAKLDANLATGGLLSAKLMLGGAVTIGQSLPLTSSVLSTFTFGSPTYLWADSWTYANVNDPTFGVQLQASMIAGSGTRTVSVRNVNIKLYLSGGLTVSVNPAAGTMTAVTGYKYKAAYGNGNITPTVISNATGESNNTGAFTNKLGVDVTLVASTDPQVNQIRLYRTADGGTTFLEVPTSPYPNASTTVTESAPDSNLNPLAPAPSGLQNSPPPDGFKPMEYHLNQIWGAVGNTVYRSGGKRIITGNGNEAFDPADNFVFPSRVIAMVATPLSTGLIIIFTTSGAFAVVGNDTTFLYPVPFLKGYVGGILSPNALEVYGSLIWLFQSNKILNVLDPSSGVSESGFPIGDQLADLDPAQVYVARHDGDSQDSGLFLAQPQNSGTPGTWNRLNPTPAPETGMCWSPTAEIAASFSAVQSIETSAGHHQLLLGPATGSIGPILARDPSTFQDNGASYKAGVQFGNIVLAKPGQVAELAFITTDCIRSGTRPRVSVLLDEIVGFADPLVYRANDPTDLMESKSLYNDRWHPSLSPSEEAAICRHLQVWIDWAPENAPNELLTYTIFGAVYQE